ncbi:MAG: hypothetical protein KOO69_06700, partial [Victivallales bacterium]|nr:hypothetical protein [Victivallales bacterium]
MTNGAFITGFQPLFGGGGNYSPGLHPGLWDCGLSALVGFVIVARNTQHVFKACFKCTKFLDLTSNPEPQALWTAALPCRFS